jgi:hypothetical protein
VARTRFVVWAGPLKSLRSVTIRTGRIAAFETYSEKGGLKGGKFRPTAKRWRPKVEMFVDWLGHRDLARMTTDDGYSWMDHLTGVSEKIDPRRVDRVAERRCRLYGRASEARPESVPRHQGPGREGRQGGRRKGVRYDTDEPLLGPEGIARLILAEGAA